MNSHNGHQADLDGREHQEHLASDGAYERNFDLPAHFHEAMAAVETFKLPDAYRDMDQVLVAGMGGSAIAGDFLQALANREGRAPVSVVRGYSLPSWVNARTLLVICSHSGNTEETLAILEAGVRQGAKVVAVTTGGKVLDFARGQGLPVLSYDFYPEPRSAFAHSFVRLVAIATQAGLLDVSEERLAVAGRELDAMGSRIGAETPELQNQAKQIARGLHGKMPLIVGAEFLAPVARRWKTQINENSEVLAFFEELPELHHNTIVGLSLPDGIISSYKIVLLESAGLHERVKLRYELTSELLHNAGVSYERIALGGSSDLSSMLGGVLLGNAVSFYLAMLNGVRPGAIVNIDWLKDRLAQRPV